MVETDQKDPLPPKPEPKQRFKRPFGPKNKPTKYLTNRKY